MSINDRQVLVPPGHSKPVGRYSPGLAVAVPPGARMVFVSGQVATDEVGQVIAPHDAGRQAEVVFQRIDRVLSQAGGQLSDLVSLVLYLTDVGRDFAAVSAVRNRLLGDPPPTSTLVEVARLVESGCVVEISAVAVIGGEVTAS